MTDEELLETRQEIASLRRKLDKELWRRYVLTHPEFDDVNWDDLEPMGYRCTDSDNPRDVCMNRYAEGNCVFCGMSDWRE